MALIRLGSSPLAGGQYTVTATTGMLPVRLGTARLGSIRDVTPDSDRGVTIEDPTTAVAIDAVRDVDGSWAATASTDVAITASSFFYDGKWFNDLTPGLYTPTSPYVARVVYRNPVNAYLNGESNFNPAGPFALAPRPNEPRLHLSSDLEIRPQPSNNLLRYVVPEGSFRDFALADREHSWPAMQSLTGVADGHTIRESTLNSFTVLRVNAVRRTLGVRESGYVSISATTAVLIEGVQSHSAYPNMDGATAVSIAATHLSYAELLTDGATDVAITDTSYLEYGWQADAATSVSIDVSQIYAAGWQGDGATDVELTPFNEETRMDGNTAIAISSNVDYNNNTITMDGHTNVVENFGRTNYAAAQWEGAANVSIVPSRIRDAFITSDGVTDVSISAGLQDSWYADARTSVLIDANKLNFGEIVCTGVGDLNYGAVRDKIGYATMDGSAIVSADANARFSGASAISGSTSVSFVPIRIVQIHINIDGSTDVNFAPVQAQLGEIVFDQIDQTLSATLSFILQGTITSPATSSIALNATHYILGPDYLFGVIKNETYAGSEYTPITPDNYTLLSKKAIATGSPIMGGKNFKYVTGFSRPARSFSRKLQDRFLRDEWVRFEFFVEQALDNTQISDTLAFSSSGHVAMAGSGVVGRIVEDYVTLSVLTRVYNTQTNLELLRDGDPSVLATEVVSELLWSPASSAYMTQAVGEVLYLANLAAIQQVAVELLGNAFDLDNECMLNQVAIETLSSIRAATLVTSVVNELLCKGESEVLVTSVYAEVLTRSQEIMFALAIINQVAAELLHDANPSAVINHVAAELLQNGDSRARVGHVAGEALHAALPKVNVQQIAAEQLQSGDPNVNVNHIAIEMLVKSVYDPTVASLVNNPKYSV